MRELLSIPQESIWLICSSLPVFGLAFTKSVRMIIGARDSWECQKPECDKRFWDGWMVDVAHLPELHDASLPNYNEPDSGRVLCLEHHLQDHLEMGDTYSASLIQSRINESQGGHTRRWIADHKK